jgi:hypothetical protein
MEDRHSTALNRRLIFNVNRSLVGWSKSADCVCDAQW